MGIVNGTTNYILTKMEEEGESYDDVLREAQELGLAERDPTADVEGHDAAAKAAILASLAFGSDVVDGDVHREGITGISAADVAYAGKLGYSVKLLAVAELVNGGPEISVRVHPAMVPKTHPLASVRGAFNAVFVEGAVSGELMLYGRGAGGGPTASAMLGDLVDASRNLLAGAPAPAPKRTSATVRDQNDMRAAFYLSMDVADRPGVLAAVAKIFGDHDVSIRSMEQVGMAAEARLIFLTHSAREGDLLATIDELRQHQAVDRVSGVLASSVRTTRPVPPVAATGAVRDGRLARRHRGIPRLPPGHGEDPGGHAARGGDAVASGPTALGASRRRGVAQGGGGQPDGQLQGPGHDDGHVHGARRRRQGRGVRVDRQHLGLGRRLCGAGGGGAVSSSSPTATSRSASWPRP